MATGIFVYEDNDQIRRSLIERFKDKMNDCYITDGNDQETVREIIRLCDRYIVVYDNSQYGEKFREQSDALPIFEDGLIDCGRIISSFSIDPGTKAVREKNGRLTMLISFVYMADRERYIEKNLKDLRDDHECIRIDLTPRLKSTGRPSDALEKLIKACRHKRFDPDRIMDYCVLDDRGFFTPGPAGSARDISLFPADSLASLASRANELTRSRPEGVNALIVSEDLSAEQMEKIAVYADRIILLLPDRNMQDHPEMCSLIARLSRACAGTDIELRTLNDGKDEYETAV
ncbi:MAG: hypothetical protein IKE53_07500 [Clostridiales bacterium]|nr:hypothetical protein [Clostridiales bacterium]